MTTFHPVTSSNLDAIHHDGSALHVRFKGKNGDPGPVWRYPGVPHELFEGLKAAPSPGRYFLEHIKPRFQGEKA